jgi:hypothetical protein
MNGINEIFHLISFALHLLKNPSGIKVAFQGKSFLMTHSKTMEISNNRSDAPHDL